MSQTDRTSEALWTRLNDAGEGFAVGKETDDINEIDGLGTLIQRAATDTDVAVYRAADGTLTIVGDANGPWAVQA